MRKHNSAAPYAATPGLYHSYHGDIEMKKYILSVFVVAAIGIIGCDLASPPTCITGAEKCELSRLDTGTGIYQVCGADGDWGNEFVCGAGCVDNRCASNSPIPFCETENEIKCIEQKDISIELQCLHGRWIPEICESGMCTAGAGCTGARKKCEASDSNCLFIESIGSLQAKCSDGVWTLQYCPNNAVCDGNVCVDSSIQSCGASGINCKDAIEGWASGKCINDECVITGCINGYHLDDTDSSHVVCEINSRENCGSHGNACPGDEACNEATGKCGCGADQKDCAGLCVDIQNNVQNCGQCGKICQIEHSSDVACVGGECKLNTCESGYHPFENACEKDDNTNCGAHGVACTKDNVNDSESVSCDTGVCKAVTCENYYHVYEGVCEKNDNTNCGAHGVACTKDNVADSETVSCDTGVCKAVTCENHYHVYEGACEKNDTTNCGDHGVACTKDNVPGSETVSCDTGVCLPLTCDGSHTLNGSTCMENTCTEGVVTCTNFGTTGKLYQCQGNSWNEQNDCENNLSCNKNGDDCGICMNDDVRCLDSAGIGEVSTCRQGDWSLTQKCETTSCDGKVCGECKTGDTKCTDKDGVGHIYTCEAGRWHETQSCEVTACKGKVCGKLCEGSSEYSTITFPEARTVSAYCIKSEADMRSIRDAINAGEHYPSGNTNNAYILTKDLTFTDTDWVSIGTRANPFVGLFYGNDKTITFSNTLTYNSDEASSAHLNGQGFFGSVNDSVIMNVSIENSYKFSSTSFYIYYLGGLAGKTENSDFRNIHIDFKAYPDNAYGTDFPTRSSCIGGIVGDDTESQFQNCYANVDIVSHATSLGGIVGGENSSKFLNCHASGTITGVLNNGGIAGTGDDINKPSEYVNCSSSVNLKNLADVYTNLPKDKSQRFGGLIGFIFTTSISNCYSIGNITTPTASYIGGLIGLANGQIHISDSYHVGSIVGNEFVGGVCGSTKPFNGYASTLDDEIISNSFHIGSISATTSKDSIAGYIGIHYGMNAGAKTVVTNGYTLYTTELSPNYGFLGKISDKMSSTTEPTIKNLTLTNSYYPSTATKPYSDGSETCLVSADLKTADFVLESGKYVAKSGSSLLKDVLGTGWTSYRCTMDIGSGEHEYIIPIHSDFVPDFCHKE